MLPVINLESYRYPLPKERIALYPVSPRDQSKLLVYNEQGVIREDTFQSIAHYIPSGSLMVFNQTKVIRARLLFLTTTGAHIEIFCLEPASGEEQVTALSAVERVQWKCFVGNAKRWKADKLKLLLGGGEIMLEASLVSKQEDYYIIEFSWTPSSLSWAEVLDLSGKMPLPPYIKRDASSDDEETYQTVYARIKGSVAAPTAGLHFTDRVLEELHHREIKLAYTTLHVGAGTFKPIKTNSLHDHEMHEEEVIIEQSFVEQILENLGKPLVAVGTTSVRCIESLYWVAVKIKAGVHTVSDLNVKQWDPYNLSTSLTEEEALKILLSWFHDHHTIRVSIKTSILIVPGYRYHFVNLLITNFHQPESTLMLLVAAFVGKNWAKIYQYALENDFRFLSYGDSSLLTRDCE